MIGKRKMKRWVFLLMVKFESRRCLVGSQAANFLVIRIFSPIYHIRRYPTTCSVSFQRQISSLRPLNIKSGCLQNRRVYVRVVVLGRHGIILLTGLSTRLQFRIIVIFLNQGARDLWILVFFNPVKQKINTGFQHEQIALRDLLHFFSHEIAD